jgi:sugar (pentulose or hexulose) kinase
LPRVFRPAAILGEVTRGASKSTGLCAGTIIVAGGGDGQAAGLGSNVLTPKRAYLNLGTAVVAGVYGSRYKAHTTFRTMSSCSESGYYYECSLRAGTFALDWLIKKILKIDPLKQPNIYKQLEQEAQHVSIGSDGVFHLPYLCGVMNPYWDSNARGAFTGISSSHHRGHIYRSILEGIAFEQLFAVNSVETTIGTKILDFVAIGGGAASDLWCHIFADVTGKNICIPANTEASALGAAITASVGAGWYRTCNEAAHHMTGIRNIISPDRQNHKEYQRLFMRYKKIYPSLRNSRIDL